MKLNFFIKSYFLSIFAHVGILIAALITFPEKSKSSECPDYLNMNIQTEDCYQTPDVMEIKFYELVFVLVTHSLVPISVEIIARKPGNTQLVRQLI